MSHRILTAKLVGESPYSASRHHGEPLANAKEKPDDYDARTWREKAHYHPDSRELFIPAMGLKFAICEAARRLSTKIPGKGQQTYTKNFVSGILLFDPLNLGISVDEAACETVYVHANGQRGSGKRVWRRFPIVPRGWQSTATVHVLDAVIPNSEVERALSEAGMFIGLGRFRPENGGLFGRFTVKSLKWETAAT